MDTISIIIPTLNDCQELEALLERIRSWPNQPHEVIVVDAADESQCESLCQRYSTHYHSFSKNRGAQQKYGAEKATGEILWFLHADSRPHSDSLEVIKKHIASGLKGGFFAFKFATPTTTLSQWLISFFTNWRSKHFSVYGDQGLFFEHEAYFAANGHADQPLFEDVSLTKQLRKVGFKPVGLSIGVSARKWQRDGYWTRTIKNRYLAIRYAMGTPVEALNKQYYANSNSEK